MVQFTAFATVVAVAAVGVLAKDKPVTTDIFLVGFDSQKLVGSVIASDASATTFSLTCSETKNCEFPTSFIFTQGPSTMHYIYSHLPTASDDPARTVEVGCVITASDHGECSKSLAGSLGTITSTAASATTTFTNGGSALRANQAVTITAGNLVIPSSTVSTTEVTSSTSTIAKPTSTTPLNDGSFAMPTPTSADVDFFEATKSIAISTNTSKAGAMPMITGNARYVMGGAAAAIALAVL